MATIELAKNMDVAIYTKDHPIITKGTFTALQEEIVVELPMGLLVVIDTTLTYPLLFIMVIMVYAGVVMVVCQMMHMLLVQKLHHLLS